ncbi:hypothetical protein HWV62_9327 [Athelia sp. TMB]|nr:hypothetical protein HWV62_9327 [Athelia sp. TMB]
MSLQVGRKTVSNGAPSVIDLDSSSSSSSESPESQESSSDPEVDEPDEEKPSMDALAAKLTALMLPTLRMQDTKALPFLIRNLRAGFVSRCRSLGISTEPVDEKTTLRIVYRVDKNRGLSISEFLDEYTKTETNSYTCPLCNLHGSTLNWLMLGVHLEWDHPEVRTRCFNEGSSRKIIMLILDPPAWSSSILLNYHSEYSSLVQLQGDEPPDLREHTIPVAQASEAIHISPMKETLKKEPPIIILNIPDSLAQKLKNRSPSPTASSTPSTRSRSQTVASSVSMHESSSQTPLAEAYLGPSAQYLSPSIDHQYSRRPGGPRLYDILDDLSLSEHGILSWYILDREDEIFEQDDVLDEDKVMEALWNRWIMLHQ